MENTHKEAERSGSYVRDDAKSRLRKEFRRKLLARKTQEKGLLIVHTGKGKGKSTAAFGMVLRALGHGMRVGIVQFVKGRWESGERRALSSFGEQVDIRVMGEGFSWETQNRAQDIRAAQAAWQTSKTMIGSGRSRYHLILLDESQDATPNRSEHFLTVRESLGRRGCTFLAFGTTVVVRLAPSGLHVIVTGRNAKPELISIADLVTEMTLVKHPFRDQNVRAQKGVEF